MADFERDYTLPLSGEEMRRLKGRKPAGKPPKALADIEDKPPPVRKIKFIDRPAAKDLDAPEVLEGIVPKWVGTSFSPKRIGMAPPPVVTHHQERLEPFVIHQPDDRQMYNDPTYPWICVCRITRADGGVGSGVIIGPRHVLTASHVVQWNTDVAEKVEVHLVGNTARATAFATVAYAYTKITGDPTYSTVDCDYAVLTVDQRMSGTVSASSGPSSTNSCSLDGDHVWQTIGYATDVLAFLAIRPTRAASLWMRTNSTWARAGRYGRRRTA